MWTTTSLRSKKSPEIIFLCENNFYLNSYVLAKYFKKAKFDFKIHEFTIYHQLWNIWLFYRSQMEFLQEFFSSGCTIALSEFGDKTFFIAAVLAMKYSARLSVFVGAMLANLVMVAISGSISAVSAYLSKSVWFPVILGYFAHTVPVKMLHYVTIALFAAFGLKMLHEAWNMDDDEAEDELREALTAVETRTELKVWDGALIYLR